MKGRKLRDILVYLMALGSMSWAFKSFGRLKQQAERDAIYRENRIEDSPPGFPPDHLGEKTNVPTEYIDEISEFNQTHLDRDQDPDFLYWSVDLGIGSFAACVYLSTKSQV
jgi:hypothetical protein